MNELTDLLRYLTPRERAEVDRLLTVDLGWHPFSGPQTSAMNSEADVIYFGGQAGGGKTDLLLGLAHRQHQNSIIFRREATQLIAVEQRAREILQSKGTYNGQDKIWKLNDGRYVEFGAVKDLGDEQKYQGRPHDFIGFDEIPHFMESQFRFLTGWLRTKLPNQRCRVVAAGNPPMTSDGEWIIQYWGAWLDPQHPYPAAPGELRWYARLDNKDVEVESGRHFEHKGEMIVPQSRTFFPASVDDNPVYLKSGYKAQLQTLPEPMRSQLLYGSFTAGTEDRPRQLIPTEWVRLAQERWERTKKPLVPMSAMGVDCARGGKDQMVIAPRYGNYFDTLLMYPGISVKNGPAAAAIIFEQRRNNCPVNVDIGGIGTAVYDALEANDDSGLIVAMNGASGSIARDKSGQLDFLNARAEWYWKLREDLDPASGMEICLPPSRTLLSDLCAPSWELTVRGIKIESKDEIIKRIGRSPDEGDAVVYAHAIKYIPGAGLLDFMMGELHDRADEEDRERNKH